MQLTAKLLRDVHAFETHHIDKHVDGSIAVEVLEHPPSHAFVVIEGLKLR